MLITHNPINSGWCEYMNYEITEALPNDWAVKKDGEDVALFVGENARHNAAVFVAALKREQAAINAITEPQADAA